MMKNNWSGRSTFVKTTVDKSGFFTLGALLRRGRSGFVVIISSILSVAPYHGAFFYAHGEEERFCGEPGGT